ncbi:COG3014 family protein [Vibrio sp. D449a]|uniref:COG3014 family protein n=1 Tax=unclassified Vibrio TaxID=2614977 RepID=UPI00358ED398
MSAGNLFSHYSAQNQSVYQALKAGDYSEAQQELPDYAAGDILDNLEKGRVYLLDQQYPESKSWFEQADQAVRVQQDKAVVSVSDSAASVGALAVNDNITEYTPADYELGFLHLYLGLNYLKQNDLEGALVEMRRANQVQEQAKKQREAELQRAANDAKSKGISANVGSILSNYPDAGKKLQSVQNAYLMFLSGLLYEASNDLNSAYVDYRRALAVMPDNQQVIERAMLVAQRLGMREDLAKMKKRYAMPAALKSGQGRVIVLDEQSVVQAMDSWRLDLPIYDSRDQGAIYSLALPYYSNQPSERFASIRINGTALNGSLLTDVDAMAQNDLSERLPSIVIRQALRVVAKDRIRKEAANGDDVGNLLFNVWNTLTEQPDTRSWQSLPAQVKSSTYVANAGNYTLEAGGKSYQFDVRDGQTTLVWVSRQGNNATMWHKQLGRL